MDDTAWVDGEVSDTAILFDGFDDILILAPEGVEPIDFHRDFTWAAWVSTMTGGTILAKSPTFANWAPGAMGLFVRDGLLTFDVGWVSFVNALVPVNDGEWRHVAVTAAFDTLNDNDRVELYIDGVLDTLKEDWDIQLQGPPPGDFKAGFASANFPLPLTYLAGMLDEIRIWDYVLSAEELMAVFEDPGADCEGEPPVEEAFSRGDVNVDEAVNIADAINLLGHLFGDAPAPSCPDAGDANDDGALNIADAITILGHLFGGGGPLPDPFGECGVDPEADALSPCVYLPCR